MVGVVWQAREARIYGEQARQRLVEMRTVMHNLVFRFGDSITYLPGGMNIKEDLLKETLVQLQRLADASDSDSGILSDVATLNARLAALQFEDTGPSLDRPAQARFHSDQAILLGRRVWGERRGDALFASIIANAHMTRARLERSVGKHLEGVKATQSARALVRESLALQHLDESRAVLHGDLAATFLLEAQMLAAPNLTSLNRSEESLIRLGEAEAAYRQFLKFDDKVFSGLDANRRPEDARAKAIGLNDLATTLQARGLIRLQADHPELALPDMQAAVRVQEQVLTIDPNQTPWHDGAGSKNNDLAITFIRLGKFADALVPAERAWREANALAESKQAIPRWKHQVANYGLQFGIALARLGRHADAVPIFDQCLLLLEQRIKETTSGKPATFRRLGEVQVELSRSKWALGKKVLALQLAKQASKDLQAQVENGKPSRDLLITLGQALAWQAEIEPESASVLQPMARMAYNRAGEILSLSADNAAALKALR